MYYKANEPPPLCYPDVKQFRIVAVHPTAGICYLVWDIQTVKTAYFTRVTDKFIEFAPVTVWHSWYMKARYVLQVSYIRYHFPK